MFKSLLPSIAVVLCLTFSTVPVAFADPTPLQTAVDNALTNGCLDHQNTSVKIVTLEKGAVLYEKNSNTPLLPASTLKLITTASALYWLGPEYTFKTKVYYTGDRIGDTLTGDLYMVGGGDPKLTPETMYQIARTVSFHGIRKINGAVVVDDSFFDRDYDAPTWADTRSQRAYDAKLGALSANFNTVAVHVFPGVNAGDPLIVSVDPASVHVTINNQGKTVANGKRDVTISRSVTEFGVTITVTGTLRVGDEEKLRYANVGDPPAYAAAVFLDALDRAGINVDGGLAKGALPKKDDPVAFSVTKLFEYESAPLADILRQLNRFSNNFIAEQVAKTIAAEILHQPGSHAGYYDLTKRLLGEMKIDATGCVLADGSGLSRQNRITTTIMTKLLVGLHQRYDLWPDYIAAIGALGTEGSMKQRLAHSPARRFVRAKTGSLNGVSNLVGVMTTADGTHIAFAIFLNENHCGHEGADSIEDKIVTAIYTLDGGAQ
jgi:D-alanyl-D-alanine carboxypeptidase/D-alanyl-D-alanine-endopeptidase (penicillin-binding protein 4)